MNDGTASLQEKLDHFKKEIQKMQRDVTHGHKKPHKLVMMLAVLDLFDKKIIIENKIYFNDDLAKSFLNIFNLIRIEGDWNQPAPPFFHLRTSSFWKHKVKSGREVQYANLSTSGGGTKRIEENIDYAYLDSSTYQLFSNKEMRQSLRELIIAILNPLSNFENSAPIE